MTIHPTAPHARSFFLPITGLGPEPPRHVVYVASFAQSRVNDAVDGFDVGEDFHEIADLYELHVAESKAAGGSHIVRLVEMDIGTCDPESVCEACEERLYEIEIGAPALRQYVPACAEPDWVPVGETSRWDR